MPPDTPTKPAKPRPAEPPAIAEKATKPAVGGKSPAGVSAGATRPASGGKPSRGPSKTRPQPPAQAKPEADRANPVMQFVRNLFVRQVKLERKGGDIHLVLQEPASTQSGHSVPQPVPSTGSEAKPSHAALLGISSSQLKRMRHQLSAVLDLHPSTRSVFPHLNYLDKALRRQGADCFRDLPVEVLHKALKQMDALVQSAHPGPVGLAELRACLVVSAVDRGTPETEVDTQGEPSGLSSSLSDFNVSGKLSVNEVSHSDFMKANQQWETAGETIKLKT